MEQIALYLQRLVSRFARQKQFIYFSGDYLQNMETLRSLPGGGLIFMTDIPRRIYIEAQVFPDHGHWTSGHILDVCVLAYICV